MHRHALLKLLSEYSKQFPQEQDICSRFIHFVNCEPDCLKRTLKVGHVTASSWVLSPDCNEVLLTHHRKLGFWVQLGGHVDGQSEILQAALREAREESGIPNINPLSESLFDLDIHSIPENSMEASHLHYDTRFLLQADTKEFQISSESLDLAWVPLDHLEDYTQENSIRRMRDKQKSLG